MGMYLSWRGKSFFAQIKTLFLAWTFSILLLSFLFFLFKMGIVFSRIWFVGLYILTFVLLSLLRLWLIIFLKIIRKWGWNRKNIIIYGAGQLGKSVAENTLKKELGFNITAFIDDNETLQGTSFLGIPIYSSQQVVLNNFIEENKVVELWLALPLRAQRKINEIFFELRHNTILFRFIPDIFSFRFLLNHSVSNIAGITTLDINYTPISGLNRVIKAIEDRVFAILFLMIASPIMCLIAIAIKLESKGPIFFKQRRHGWDGKPINVYKFRSMKIHQEEKGQVTQATKEDPRVTKVGRIIRKTSLDELPQFYNVLQGRMSIVGPRPHPIVHNEYYKDQIEGYFQRHKVKPGVTGWAQINGWRGEIENLEQMQKRVEFDLYYIQNWSLWFDLKIIFLTLFKGFVGKRAY